jgi:molybdenum cofactor cytidylyltransferase
VVYLLADQPHVSKELLSSLVELHATTFAPLVAPEVQGQRGNPVLFDRQTFPALFALEGDVGGRPLFSRYKAIRLPWHDPSILLDIDSPEDYRQLLEG